MSFGSVVNATGVSAANNSGGGIGLSTSGIIAQVGTPASVTGTLTETVLATVLIPKLSPNSRIRIRTWWSAGANNANTKTVTAKLNGTLIATSGGLANALSAVFPVDLLNRGATNVQIDRQGWSGALGTSTGAFNTYAIDTSIPTTLTFTATLGVTTDTLTLEAYSIELLNP